MSLFCVLRDRLHLIHFEKLGLYVYASTESIMAKALRKVGFTKLACEKIQTEEGDIFRIDINGNITRSQFEVKDNFRCSKWFGCYDNSKDDYYTQHEELLLELCGYYGVDEDDIILLLDYGYTADEIEDMLCDYSLITDTIKAVKGQEDYDDFLCEI